MQGMEYPLKLRCKVLAMAPQIFLEDAQGNSIAYIRQKMFKFKEHVEVYTSKDKQNLVANINANKIIDWSAKYTFTDSGGAELGSVGRQGMRSLWKATYIVFAAGTDDIKFTIEEENPFAKIFDALLGEIPVVGILSTVLFQPKYIVKRSGSDEIVLRLTKKPALFESKFELSKLAELTTQEELNLLLSLQMLTLLERSRG